MIRKTLEGIEYSATGNPWCDHAAVVYGFLLNTPERRGRWHTWAELAALMTGYSDNPGVRLIAAHVAAQT